MFEANYLTMLLKPNFEKPIDTAEDVFDRKLTVIKYPGLVSSLEILKSSPFNITRTLAERTIVCKDWAECEGEPYGTGLIPEAVKTGSSVLDAGRHQIKLISLLFFTAEIIKHRCRGIRAKCHYIALVQNLYFWKASYHIVETLSNVNCPEL